MNPKLIEGYVNAVKSFLPGQQQDDIARELLEDIHMRIEAREAELDRPLADAEQEALLKRLGHPAVVAGRYSSDTRSVAFGRQLIGPALFPLYVKVLAISVSLASAGALIARLVLGDSLLASLAGVLQPALVNALIITAIFTVAQYHINRYPDHWDVRDPLGGLPQVKDTQAVSRFEVFVELVVGAVLLGWLWSLRTSDFALGPLSFAPIVRQMYWPFLVFAAISLIPSAVSLSRPRWLAFRYGARLVFNLVWLVLMVMVLRAGEWVLFAAETGPAVELFANINQWIEIGLWIGLAIGALEVLYDLYRLARLRRRQAAANGADVAFT